MLKNKFGMTKVLVLVLSVLMLVSLVACNKADGPSTDDMNAAIQAAIDAANAEQAAKEAALAASIAADKAAQEAKDAALAESLAKEKAENDAALKKAQEEAAAAKKAADEAAKKAADEAAAAKKAAEDAAKKAAEDASKKAQEEAAAALKAAEEAAKKAQEEAAAALKAAEEAAAKAKSEADRVASELAAELEAAKAEALKAQEEAAKAQEEASKAQAEASKAAEEAAKASSQLAETTVVPATDPAETTVVAPAETTVAPETTTEAPVVIVDKTDALLAYSQLKVKYTITDKDMYLTNDYAELVLLFDKASIDLNNAATAEAAASIVATLEIDAKAVANVKSAAADVQALIAGLGDIESEVFTAQAEKIVEARDAYKAFKKTYKSYLDNATDKQVKALGINNADLDRAEEKLDVLKAYITVALQGDMSYIYSKDARQRYDATVSATDTSDDALIKARIPGIYYQYLILSAINDGNVAFADLPVKFEQKLNADGTDYVDDTTKPIEWFTVEDLFNVYILPTLDAELDDYATGILSKFDTAINESDENVGTLYSDLNGLLTANKPAYRNISYELNGIYNDLRDAYYNISFAEDFKGNATMKDAKYEIATMAIKAYIEALNVYFAEAKGVAIQAYETVTTNKINAENTKITAAENAIAATENTATIERQQANIAKAEAAIVKAEADLETYKANVEAAALLTYDEMLNKDLAKTAAYKNVWFDLTTIFKDKYDHDSNPDTDKVDQPDSSAVVKAFLHNVVKNTMNLNFAVEITETPDDPMEAELEVLRTNAVNDLLELAMMVSPYSDEWRTGNTKDGSIYTDLKKTYGKYDVDAEGNSLEGEVKNTQFFLDIIAALNTAIDGIEAVTVEDYQAKYDNVQYVNADDATKTIYFKSVDTYNYAVKTHEYTPDDFATIEKVIADTDLWKTDATSYPVQFVITPAEQAIEEVAKQYVAAFEAFNKTVATELNSQDSTAKNAKKLITNSSSKTAFDKTIDSAAGTLKTELENVRNAYTGSIDTLVTTFAMNFADDGNSDTNRSNNANVLTVSKIYRVNKIYRNDKDATKTDVYVNNKKFVLINSTANYSANYDYDEFKNAINDKVLDFYKTIYNENAVTTNTTKTDIVSQLWNKKLTAIADINTKLAAYKNSYATDSDTGVTTVTKTAKYGYGVAGAATQPAYVAEYEAKLDELAKATIDKIMALEIGSTTKITVANPAGGEFCKDKQINYSLDTAQTVINAYVNELFGTAGTYAQANNAAAGANNKYDQGNSAIFNAYNSIVLGNSYGYIYIK